ncbi:MAG: flavodoxin [Firmicutes bacterium]|nr:flavodoxin [Bacillota bacterium]
MKTRSLKCALSCLLIIMMTAALAACGSQPQQSQPTGGDISSSSEAEQSTGEKQQASDGKTLVVYFSATGNTKTVAEHIAKTLNADTYEITPEQPYTSDDLNYRDDSSRVSKEHEDPTVRPDIAGDGIDMSGYDTVFIGYPIWWGEAPNIVWNFVESSDLSGKTVIPFCTSSSSGIGSSGETLKGFAPEANWKEGQRFSSGVSENDVTDWINTLGL